ncbi:hypothetical protein [Nocardiopsis alba]|uniref:hypothetical protein n=1 Tax=Nocardiopsis alba TaxID=53437 RepID=UPI0033BA81DC
MQPPEHATPGARLAVPEREALTGALRRLANPGQPRAVRAGEVVVTLHGTTTTIHTEK